MKNGKCFLCGTDCQYKENSIKEIKNFFCPICGKFGLTGKAEVNYKDTLKIKEKISFLTREQNIASDVPFVLSDKTHGLRDGIDFIGVEDFVSRYPKNSSETIERALLNLSRTISKPSESIKLTETSRAILFSSNFREMLYMAGFLRKPIFG